MDWLVLLVLTPLIVVAVVFLIGFAGCFTKPEPPEYGGPLAPSDLVATATGTDTIDLSWVDNSTDATDFRIRRSDDAGATFSLIGEVQAPETTYSDSGLNEGQYYQYQVFAFAMGSESDGSNIAEETTLTWKPSFDQGPTGTVGTDGPGSGGRCVVQRIPAILLALGGPGVRLTLRSSTMGNLRLEGVSISHAAPTGDPWDSASDLVPVLFGGNPLIVLALGQPGQSDETAFALDKDKDLIVAFDIGAPGAVRRRIGVPGATAYSRGNTTPGQAGLQDRLPNFQPETPTDVVFIVEKVEVLARVTT
jgi:hypothetical protein